MPKIVIDPGHGANETGAVANGYVEKNLNLELSFLLKNELERCGCEVIMTRTTDSENPSLSERGNKALQNEALMLLSIHFNAYNGQAKGFEAIYTFTPEQQRKSAQWVGECIAEEVSQLGLYKRGVWTKESGSYKGQNYYGVLRSSQDCVALILEGLFLDNTGDIQFLQQTDFLKKLAIAYAKGICKAWGWKYIPETTTEQTQTESTTNNTVSNWKNEAMKYLKDNGYIMSDHDPDEVLTFATFGAIMKNKGWK